MAFSQRMYVWYGFRRLIMEPEEGGGGVVRQSIWSRFFTHVAIIDVADVTGTFWLLFF